MRKRDERIDLLLSELTDAKKMLKDQDKQKLIKDLGDANGIIKELKGDLDTMIKSYDDKLMEIMSLRKRLTDEKREAKATETKLAEELDSTKTEITRMKSERDLGDRNRNKAVETAVDKMNVKMKECAELRQQVENLSVENLEHKTALDQRNKELEERDAQVKVFRNKLLAVEEKNGVISGGSGSINTSTYGLGGVPKGVNSLSGLPNINATTDWLSGPRVEFLETRMQVFDFNRGGLEWAEELEKSKISESLFFAGMPIKSRLVEELAAALRSKEPEDPKNIAARAANEIQAAHDKALGKQKGVFNVIIGARDFFSSPTGSNGGQIIYAVNCVDGSTRKICLQYGKL